MSRRGFGHGEQGRPHDTGAFERTAAFHAQLLPVSAHEEQADGAGPATDEAGAAREAPLIPDPPAEQLEGDTIMLPAPAEYDTHDGAPRASAAIGVGLGVGNAEHGAFEPAAQITHPSQDLGQVVPLPLGWHQQDHRVPMVVKGLAVAVLAGALLGIAAWAPDFFAQRAQSEPPAPVVAAPIVDPATGKTSLVFPEEPVEPMAMQPKTPAAVTSRPAPRKPAAAQPVAAPASTKAEEPKAEDDKDKKAEEPKPQEAETKPEATTPVEPASPAEPETPAEPEPATPDEPEPEPEPEPATPEEPVSPTEPEDPQPAEPVEPADPEPAEQSSPEPTTIEDNPEA